ncbi:N-acetyl-alpha-D-glucosaminyl-diphospho-ditrans,octacis-undecaprenol 4-epimerase [Castellaniella denitrificans]
MNRVLVTGGNGFIGRALCAHLSELRVDVVPVVRQLRGVPGERIVGDDPIARADILDTCCVVVHLAGNAQAPRRASTADLEEFRANQVDLACGWAQAAASAGVRRFIFVSLAKVNGECTTEGIAFSPNDTPAPHDVYAQSKWDTEQALQLVAADTGMELVIVRPPLVYGPNVKGNFAAMIRAVCQGWPLPLGAIKNLRSMIAVTNLVDFLSLCADRSASPAAAGRIFMVSDGRPVSTPDLLRLVARVYGCTARLLPVPAGLLGGLAHMLGRRHVADRLLGSLVLDDSLAHDLLGWKPVVTLEEQLRVMANAKNM